MSNRKPTAVDIYHAETFMFGGEEKTRGEIIVELENLGGTRAMIDRYLQGADQAKRLARISGD